MTDQTTMQRLAPAMIAVLDVAETSGEGTFSVRVYRHGPGDWVCSVRADDDNYEGVRDYGSRDSAIAALRSYLAGVGGAETLNSGVGRR